MTKLELSKRSQRARAVNCDFLSSIMSKHHPGKLSAEVLHRYHLLTPKVDLIMCRRQPGIGMFFVFRLCALFIET